MGFNSAFKGLNILQISADLSVDGKDDIKMDLQVVGWGSMERIEMAQDRDRWREVVNTVIMR